MTKHMPTFDSDSNWERERLLERDHHREGIPRRAPVPLNPRGTVKALMQAEPTLAQNLEEARAKLEALRALLSRCAEVLVFGAKPAREKLSDEILAAIEEGR